MRTKPLLFLVLFFAAGFVQAMPEIEHWATKNGARVYYVHAPQLPMVDVQVVFDGGSARDEGKPGRAVLTNALLAEGAGGLDADAIARRFEDVGASFGNDALRDMAYVALRTLTEPALMKQAVDTAALVLNKPDFPQTAIDRERSRILVSLRRQEQSPETIAEKAFFRALYDTHPYAHPPLGTEVSMQALARDDLRTHYRRYYVARNAVVAIVGDVDRATARRLADTLVGRLPAGEPAPALPAVPARTTREEVNIPFPSAQTHILVGQPGMRRDDPDYFALYVGNHVLGGGSFTSRITKAIREERGFAYSAYSYFSPMAVEGPFQVGMQTATRNRDEALQVLRETVTEFVAKGPTAAELEASKKNITGGFPLRIDSNRDIVQYLAVIGFYGLPLDYLEKFNARVDAVTVAQIRDAFQRRIRPDAMAVVSVGASQ
ncbi:MAG: pitrilysin family protein [Thiohalomonadaceae bacterium]